jgi:hypothetical protein
LPAVAGYLAVALVMGGSACSDGAPEGLSRRHDVSMEDLGDALGCDALRRASYERGFFLESPGPPSRSFEAERGRDCYRDGRFVGRLHLFAGTDAEEVMESLSPSGPASHQPECHREPLQVVVGDRWAVVTRSETSADEVRERTGGEQVAMPAGSTTFTSYAMPCVGEAEPD